jgi:hypothetical protein
MTLKYLVDFLIGCILNTREYAKLFDWMTRFEMIHTTVLLSMTTTVFGQARVSISMKDPTQLREVIKIELTD